MLTIYVLLTFFEHKDNAVLEAVTFSNAIVSKQSSDWLKLGLKL